MPEKVRALVEHELRLIAELRYEAYFLTVFDMVRFARRRGILCQGRGSAANSAVCYCLGVTAVDPDRMEVLFERFVSRERNEAPDIDIDFEHERREEVLQYLYEKYGRERAGMTAEVITLSPALGGARRGQGAGIVARSGRRPGQGAGRPSRRRASWTSAAARLRSIRIRSWAGGCWDWWASWSAFRGIWVSTWAAW